MTDMPAPLATVTQRLVGLAGARGEHPALVGGPATWPGGTLSHADLAVILQTAAAGLAWRGLRNQDVVAVYVPDAVSYVLAAHAIRAAGGVPSPISAASTVAAVAEQLRDEFYLRAFDKKTSDRAQYVDDPEVQKAVENLPKAETMMSEAQKVMAARRQ